MTRKKLNEKKKIEIILTENEMNAIEDQFFCELTDKQHMKIRPKLLSVWERLCNAMGDKGNK